MIGQAIQLALTPVFVLAAIGTIIAVLSTRLGRVVDRARTLLSELSVQHVGRPKVSRNRKSDKTTAVDENQLPLFVDPARELIAQLAGTQVEALTPMQAFDLLRQWKEKYGR